VGGIPNRLRISGLASQDELAGRLACHYVFLLTSLGQLSVIAENSPDESSLMAIPHRVNNANFIDDGTMSTTEIAAATRIRLKFARPSVSLELFLRDRRQL